MWIIDRQKQQLAKKDVEIDKLKNCLSNKKCMHEDNFKSILDEKDAEIKRLRGSIKDLLEARKSEIERLEAELGKVLKDMAKLEAEKTEQNKWNKIWQSDNCPNCGNALENVKGKVKIAVQLDERKPALTAAETKAVDDIISELRKAEKKWPSWPDNPFEAIAIVAEELGELTKEILHQKHENGEFEDMKKEAVQTAAMAFRFYKGIEALAGKEAIKELVKKPALTAKDPLDEIFVDKFNRSALRKINARQRAHERDINFAEERKERELKKESAKHG